MRRPVTSLPPIASRQAEDSPYPPIMYGLLLALILFTAPEPRLQSTVSLQQTPVGQAPVIVERSQADRAFEADQRQKDRASHPSEWWMIVLTGALVIVAALQIKLLIGQNEQNKQTFLATFRPRLKLRAMRYKAGTGQDGMPIGVIECSLVNIGGSKARIVGGNIGADIFVKGTPFPAVGDLKTEHNFPFELQKPPIELAGGETAFVELPLSTWLHPGMEEIGLEHHDLMVIGQIIYIDDNGIRRYYGFLRRFDPKTRRFVAVDDPDHVYDE